jgi:hypothetical protein
MNEIKLPSGSILKVQAAPFSDSKALYQAILEEVKNVQIKSNDELTNVFKDLMCISFSSKKIELCVEKCLERCLYNSGNGDFKIDKNTFEKVELRGDYIIVIISVVKENIDPFMKSLMQGYRQILSMIPGVPA